MISVCLWRSDYGTMSWVREFVASLLVLKTCFNSRETVRVCKFSMWNRPNLTSSQLVELPIIQKLTNLTHKPAKLTSNSTQNGPNHHVAVTITHTCFTFFLGSSWMSLIIERGSTTVRLYLTLSFGENPWFDLRGQIQRCDWSWNSFFCMCPVAIHRPRVLLSQSQRRIYPGKSKHGISPNNSGWPLLVLLFLGGRVECGW
jgi:hypothetical protein